MTAPSITEHPTVIFDGYCNLCSLAVDFIRRWDRAGVFRCVARQDEAGDDLLARHGCGPGTTGTIFLLDQGRLYRKSAAVLRIAGRLGLPWSLARVLWVIPRPLRDWMYDWVARNRYRWFGRREVCRCNEGPENLPGGG